MQQQRFFIVCFIAGILLGANAVDANGCPARCTCQQKSVRCMRLQLTEIPKVPSDTTILDLRYNHIREIPSNTFTGLIHLHTIFINENQLTTIHPDAFHGLPSLKYLYLNRNHIEKIAANAFNGLTRLQSLYLQSNNLSQFDAETFSNLPHLEKLFLYNNRIIGIPYGSFTNTTALKRLRLDSNAINCDCSMMWLVKMLRKTKNRIQAAITCNSPHEMNGKNLVGLSETDFNCKPPTLTEEPTDVTVDFGGSVTFNCSAIGNPDPDIIWIKNSTQLSVLDDPRFEILDDGSLKINNADDSVADQYECMAKNAFGEAKSRAVRAIMADGKNGRVPEIILPPYDLTISTAHQAIVLHCVVTGFPEPQIVWYINGIPLSQSTETSRVHTNGTLIIENPNTNVSGTYKCEATNSLGTVSATADVRVDVLPRITVAPENLTARTGAHIMLECEADGEPMPKIMWKRNDQPLVANNRISFDSDNMELHIDHLKASDGGRYVCVAENSVGSTEAVADIIVEVTSASPKFLFEPYDIDTMPGATIELPCQGEGTPEPEVKWKKDGKTIIPSAKHRIASSGSLYIKKLTDQDAGRYECSLINQYGRVTASGLITIRSNDVIPPTDRIVHIAFREASQEIDNAINQTISNLFGKARDGKGPKNHADLFQLFRYPNAPTRELARAAEIYERTLVNIRKHLNSNAPVTANMTEFNYKDILSPEHLNLVAQLSGCLSHRITPNCTNMCYHLKYRSLDGTCNNLQHPTWGASLTGFRRLLKPIYENGFSTPIGWNKGKLYYGFPKPSARLVSTTVISTNVITPDEVITHLVMQWGQFLDHDLDHAIPSVSSESWEGVDCKKTCEYAAPCYPIEVPPNDPRVTNRRCIDLVRSSSICGSGMTSVFFDTVQPREQINQLTSYIDASQVYGYSQSYARDLRNLTTNDGLLRTGVNFPNQKSMLPFATPTDGIDCRRDVEESTVNCFAAGDIRANEQIGLVAMHTIWLREHNRIAQELKRINPHWDGETLYQEARKIVGAQMQHITYTQWLPNVIGPQGMETLGEYKGYDPSVHPSVSNEFATAALRFGHTLINPILHRLNESFETIPQGHLPLHKAFFAPWRLVYEGGVDPLLRGMFSVPAKLKLPQENLNTELTEKLFLTAHAVALDLAAINIQRSRDHGIPGYTEYRRICNLSVPETFDDLKSDISNDDVRMKLKELYGHPGNVDIFVGGILEDKVPGSKIGPLFQCLLIEQFARLRSGDRHWYENPSTFKPEQLTQIKQASLARVLCDNGDNITKIQSNVFHLANLQGGFKDCHEIPEINLNVWLNCEKCSSNGIDPNTYQTPDPSVLPINLVPVRQRRSIRMRRNVNESNSTRNGNNRTEDHHNLDDDDDDNDDNDNFIDMNDERIDGLESIIDSFQKTMKQMRKRIKKLEQTCSAPTSAQCKPIKSHSQCVDDQGNHRFNNEVWSKDECTRCECNHHQVNCITQKCPTVVCGGMGIEAIKLAGECCAKCPIGGPLTTNS